jgi:hypothetical protein
MARINGGQLDQIEIAIEDFERICVALNGLGVVCVGVFDRHSLLHFVHLDEKGAGRLDRGWGRKIMYNVALDEPYECVMVHSKSCHTVCQVFARPHQ